MSPDLLFKAIFRYWNYFMSSVATDGVDGQSLKLEKIGPTFSSFNVMPQKNNKFLTIFSSLIYPLSLPKLSYFSW